MEVFKSVKGHQFNYVKKGKAISYDDFLEQIIKPQFKNSETIQKIHNSLVDYINTENTFFLRNYNTAKKSDYDNLRRGFKIHFRKNDAQIAFCDNTFVMLFNAMKVFNIPYLKENLVNLFNQNKLICSFITTQQERELSFYQNKGGIITNSNFNAKGWQLAHINPVNFCNFNNVISNYKRSDWQNENKIYINIDDVISQENMSKIKAHFFRLIHPLNSFLLPQNKLINYEGKRLGEEKELLNRTKQYLNNEFNEIYSQYKKISLANDDLLISANNLQKVISWKNKK